MKRCIRCKELKGLSEFYEHPQMADGLLAKCKGCCKKAASERRQAKIEEVRQYDRDRANLPHRVAQRYAYDRTKNGRKAHKKANQLWSAENPRKRAAQILFRNRSRYDKSLAPLPCERCGAKAHAHHEDYDKPLEVVWLCPIHHKQRHREMKKEGIIP